MTVDEIRNALMKYRPGELAGKTDAAFSRAVQYAVSILANEKREEYKNFIKTAECCDIKSCKDCPLRNDGMCREVAMEKLAVGLEKELAEVKCLKDRIRELEAQHRTEMYEAGYDCVQLGKVRREKDDAEEIASNLCDDFTDFVTGGVYNAAPYCANKRPECVNVRGWCNGDNRVCRGFLPHPARITAVLKSEVKPIQSI